MILFLNIKHRNLQLKLIKSFEKNFNKYFIACRPSQWTKNLIVFSAPLFSFSFERNIWLSAVYAFFIFCLISSSIYLINDSLDVKSDRNHPRKKFRPIASGKVSIRSALLIATVLFISSLVIAWTISKALFLVFLLYFLIQIFYCLYLKRKPILDIFSIASGFLLRAIAGIVACSLPSSPWFLLTVGLLALFLAIEKRKAELRLSIERGLFTREVLKRYSLPLLLRLEGLVSTSSFITYSLWASGPLLGGANSPWMMISIPFVLIGIFRYQLLSDPEESERRKESDPDHSSEKPEEILLYDRGIKLTLLGWLSTIIIIGFFV